VSSEIVLGREKERRWSFKYFGGDRWGLGPLDPIGTDKRIFRMQERAPWDGERLGRPRLAPAPPHNRGPVAPSGSPCAVGSGPWAVARGPHSGHSPCRHTRNGLGII